MRLVSGKGMVMIAVEKVRAPEEESVPHQKVLKDFAPYTFIADLSHKN